MIVTLVNTASTGKTVIANLLAHILSDNDCEVIVYDVSISKSLLLRRTIEIKTELNIKDENLRAKPKFKINRFSFDSLNDLTDFNMYNESQIIFIFDISGGNPENYFDLIQNSDLLIMPIEFTEENYIQSIAFIKLIKKLRFVKANLVFLPNKYVKNMRFESNMRNSLKPFGEFIDSIPFNLAFQNIDTMRLTKNLKDSTDKVFISILSFILNRKNRKNLSLQKNY